MSQEITKANSTVLMPKEKLKNEDGSLLITISSDLKKKEMRMEFSQPTKWIEFGKVDAIDFANAFLGHIKRIQGG